MNEVPVRPVQLDPIEPEPLRIAHPSFADRLKAFS